MVPDFVALADRHTCASAFESSALSELQRCVGFEAGFFLVFGQEDHLTSSGFGPGATQNLRNRSGLYAKELAPVRRVALARRGVALDTEVLGESRVQARYFREVAQSVGGRHGLLAYLQRGGVPYGMVTLGRAGREFSRAEQERVESQLGALSVARAAYGVPWTPRPLLPGARGGVVARFRGSQTLSSVSLATGELVVRDRKIWREMVAREEGRELVWTRVRRADPRESGWPYADLMQLAFVDAKTHRRALAIGCGGGVSVQKLASLRPGIEIDVVETEPMVAAYAQEFFGLGQIPGVTVHVADGLEFVRRAPTASQDVILIDAFDARAFVEGFAQPSFLAQAARVLTKGGALACNLIDRLSGGVVWPRFVAAAERFFGRVRLVPVVETFESFSPHAERNIVVLASQTEG